MNKDRRKQIAEIIERLQELHTELEDLQGEENESYENLPESLQQGERGQAMEQAADLLGRAAEELADAISNLEEAQA